MMVWKEGVERDELLSSELCCHFPLFSFTPRWHSKFETNFQATTCSAEQETRPEGPAPAPMTCTRLKFSPKTIINPLSSSSDLGLCLYSFLDADHSSQCSASSFSSV
jgi:hypothetical protein